MNKKVFSQVVGAGAMAITLSSLVPLAASADPTASQVRLSSASTTELAQTPTARERAMTIQERTLVFSQTDRIAVRVYSDGEALLLNLFNKQTGVTEVLGGSATVTPTETGVTYRYTGEQTVEVAVSSAGEQTITLNGVPQQSTSTVSGQVFYLPRIALAPNATIEVSLLDVSRADAPATVLASAKMTANGRQVPFPFELLYDAGQIDSRRTYAVRSQIMENGELQFTSTTQTPVITNGNPTDGVELQVDPVNQSDNSPTDQDMVSDSQLTGTLWQLEQIQYNNDEQIAPTEGDYTIEFMPDGQLSIRADCNQVLGEFTTDGDRSLSVALGPATLAACGPESVDSEYLQALQSVSSYFFEEGDLYIDLQADTGTMRFSNGQ
ncbi:MAG: YbaY family lipoprotein [Cyanobacteria bacterium P01_D01_bin.1]